MIFALYSTMRALSLAGSSPEDALLARLRAGDTHALGEVYDQHHQAVRAFASRLVGDDAIAEDLVHEAFVALPQVIKRFQGESSLRSFITGVVINHARHHVRGACRRRAMLTKAGREPATEGRSPESSAVSQAFLQVLNRALDSLPLEQRVAFVLCDVEERTSGEAAELAGAPEATMRTRLFHARKKLRVELEKEGVR
jgi:RNA polymerase sigma-70 factor, ECF subfamily